MPRNEYLRHSALAGLGLAVRAHAGPGEAGVLLRECGHRVQLCLRGSPGPDFDAAVEGVLGLRPPATPGTALQRGGITLLWLGPQEWLAVSPGGDRDALLAALRAAFGTLHAAVVDVSDARAVVSVAGCRAREVLQKGCPLDLHPTRFRAGSVAGSRFARCHLLLHQTDDAPAYDLYVARSFARYLWSWLEDAAAEYGVAVADLHTM